MRKTQLTIQPPLGGMVRRTGYQNQPPFTSYSTNNFWPLDCDTGRAVLATRPAFAAFPAPGTTVNLLQPVNGHATGKPARSIVAASGSDLFWYNDDVDAWYYAGGVDKSAIDTGRAVYATTFLQQAFIFCAGRAPLVFDYPTGQCVELASMAGEAPEDCRFGAAHQGALWIAGQETHPHILYCSRTGNAYDWDALADLDDEGGAFTTAGEDEGLLNGPVTALISHTSDTMIVSTVEGLMAMRGHPRRGGVFEQVSDNVYILGQGAWCKTPGDVLYFMTPLGLMKLDPQPGAIATPVSQRLLPDKLIGLAYTLLDPVVSLAYCSRWNFIYIAVRGAQAQSWVYDLNTGGFHEMSLAAGEYPYVILEWSPAVTENRSGVLWGKSA